MEILLALSLILNGVLAFGASVDHRNAVVLDRQLDICLDSLADSERASLERSRERLESVEKNICGK